MRIMVASLSLLTVSVAASSDGARLADALEKLGDAPSKVVLYWLDPIRFHGETPSAELFHGFSILGDTEITDRSEQQALLRALARGVRGYGSDVPRCFNPRHALHVEQSGRSIDLVICFECLQVSAYGFQQNSFFTSAFPQSTFDASLRRHHLPRSREVNDEVNVPLAPK